MPRKGLAKTLNLIANTTGTYSTSKSSLAPVIWAGDSTSIPKGWEIPTNGKKLRIGVPSSSNFGQFVKDTTDLNSNMTTVTGYCIAIFEAAVAALPYAITYEYIPFVKPDGKSAGTYNDLVYDQVYLKVKPLSCFYIMLHHISTVPIGNALLKTELRRCGRRYNYHSQQVQVRRFYIALHGKWRLHDRSNQRQQKQKCLGFLEAFDLGPLGHKLLFLCFHWICGLGS